MRPVHLVVRVVTHWSEAWKVGSTLPINTTRNQNQPDLQGVPVVSDLPAPATKTEQNCFTTSKSLLIFPGGILEGWLRPTLASGLLEKQAAELQLYLHN